MLSFSNHHHICSLVHISSIKSVTEVLEDFSLCINERIFWFRYHWRAIDASLVRYIALNMSHQNHSHIMISFSNLHNINYLVHISSIKAGREVVEDFSLRRIERKFRFCYHWRAINTSFVRSIALNMRRQNHSHLMISFTNHNQLYYFVHIYSILAGTEVVEDFSLHIIKWIFWFYYHWRAIDTALVRLIALNMSERNY